MTATRNLFFALTPDPATRRALAKESERLHAAWGGRRTQEAKLHVTLLFLDAMPVPLSPEVVKAARAAADTIVAPPFDLLIDRADRFGRRVGWLGSSRVPAALQSLHDALSAACGARGVPMRHEDRYVPHLTALRDPRRAEPHHVAPIAWHVDGFRLMASAEGAYETLGRWPLHPEAGVPEDATHEPT